MYQSSNIIAIREWKNIYTKSSKYIKNLTFVIILFIRCGTSVHSLEIYVHPLVIWPIIHLILCQTFNEGYNYQSRIMLQNVWL